MPAWSPQIWLPQLIIALPLLAILGKMLMNTGELKQSLLEARSENARMNTKVEVANSESRAENKRIENKVDAVIVQVAEFRGFIRRSSGGGGEGE